MDELAEGSAASNSAASVGGGVACPPQPAPSADPRPKPAPAPVVPAQCPCSSCTNPIKPKQLMCSTHTGALNALKAAMKKAPSDQQEAFNKAFRNPQKADLFALVEDYQRQTEDGGVSGRGFVRPVYDVVRFIREHYAAREMRAGVRLEWLEQEEYVLWLKNRKGKDREQALRNWQARLALSVKSV